eukprot:SAG11_NODE_14304_length_617_cov_1.438224_1_plen_100_part_00
MCVIQLLKLSSAPSADAVACAQTDTCLDTMQVELLEPLSERERVAVAAQLERIQLAPGEEIVRQGDFGDAMFIVESGCGHCYSHLSMLYVPNHFPLSKV